MWKKILYFVISFLALSFIAIGSFCYWNITTFVENYGWPDDKGLPIPREAVGTTKFTLNFPEHEFSGMVGDYFEVRTPLREKFGIKTLVKPRGYVYDVVLKPKDRLYKALEEDYAETKDAYLYLDEEGNICVEPSVGYHDYDIDTIVERMIDDISFGYDFLTYSSSVTAPNYSTEDAENDAAQFAWLDDFVIAYPFDMKITGKDIAKQCFVDGELDLDRLDFTEFLNTVNAKLQNILLTFQATDTGEWLCLPSKSYDNGINIEAEKNFIKSAVSTQTSCPDHSVFDMSEPYDVSYVEVSIGSQHVWHYVDEELCCESDCVTGKCDNRHETPTGVFQIVDKQNGKALRPQGAKSSTWVNKWMRITDDGVGLHDATWRSSFGGNIYKNDGSHGCINLPKDYAYALYDEVSVGTPVIIHE